MATPGVRVRTRFDELEDAARRRDATEARALAETIKREFVPVHDGFVDASAATLSHFVDATGPERGEAMGRAAMRRHMQGDWFVQYIGAHAPDAATLRERVRSIVETWHWHPSLITVTEDEERVTVHSHPCGSGMRLELRGRYDGPGAWHRSVAPSASTFMQTGFPMYCNHCPEMNRAGLERGSTTWLVEGWRPFRAPERQACRQHTYKRFEDVPDEFFRRVGLEPPERPATSTPAPRLFDEVELAELSTHPCDRVVSLLGAGEQDAAIEAARASRAGWSGMRDAFPIWLVVLWEEAARELGPEGLEATLDAAAPELLASAVEGTAEDWQAFWSMHLRLREVREHEQGTSFVIGASAFLADSGVVSPELLCAALGRALPARGWQHAGTFEAAGDAIIHHLP